MDSVTYSERISPAACFIPAEADEPNENSVVARTAEVWEQGEARANEEKVSKEHCGCSEPASIKGRLSQNPRVALATAASIIFITLLIAYTRRP